MEAIKATELRINNWVEHLGKERRVATIDDVKGVAMCRLYVEGCENAKSNTASTGIYPIPLTEEWLERFGFEKLGGKAWSHKDVAFTVYWDGKRLSVRFWQGNEKLYVHQLQNLFFAISGWDLSSVVITKNK